ncbi:MAG: DUF4405 domain-containing protein [Chitinivibrionales bacterium]|nr:DUF4405 domain-containing protein [Chitinivibrionales bacterium]
MKKSELLRITNIFLALVFVIQAGGGIIYETIGLIPYEVFSMVHGKAGYVFVALVIAHLYLNWNWIKSNILVKKNK